MTLKQADPSWAEAKRQIDDPSFLNQVNLVKTKNININDYITKLLMICVVKRF